MIGQFVQSDGERAIFGRLHPGVSPVIEAILRIVEPEITG
jgi:hypothetical protein